MPELIENRFALEAARARDSTLSCANDECCFLGTYDQVCEHETRDCKRVPCVLEQVLAALNVHNGHEPFCDRQVVSANALEQSLQHHGHGQPSPSDKHTFLPFHMKDVRDGRRYVQYFFRASGAAFVFVVLATGAVLRMAIVCLNRTEIPARRRRFHVRIYRAEDENVADAGLFLEGDMLTADSLLAQPRDLRKDLTILRVHACTYRSYLRDDQGGKTLLLAIRW
jgi:hypothetical protein